VATGRADAPTSHVGGRAPRTRRDDGEEEREVPQGPLHPQGLHIIDPRQRPP